MDNQTREHFDGFKRAVNNNQLYLAIQHLSEFLDGFVTDVMQDKEDEEPEKVTTAATPRKRSAPKKSPTPKEKDEEVSD